MIITRDNLTIRNATTDDARLLCNWWNDGKIMEHAGFPKGLGTTPEAIIDKISTDTDNTHRRLIIEIDSLPAGEMNYRNLGDGIAEIGIKICNFEQQERGYGSRLLKMLIRELFDSGFQKIILDTNLKNERAQHVYEKLGFCKVGVRTNAWVNQLGEVQSAVDYELTKSAFGYAESRKEQLS